MNKIFSIAAAVALLTFTAAPTITTAQTAATTPPKKINAEVAFVQFVTNCDKVFQGSPATSKGLPKALTFYTVLNEAIVIPAVCRKDMEAIEIEADYPLSMSNLDWLDPSEEIVYCIIDENRLFIQEPTLLRKDKPFTFKLKPNWCINITLVKRN